MRKSQLWFDNKLDKFQLETIFGWLDSEHNPILDGLNELIEDYCSRNDAFGEKEKHEGNKIT